MHQNILPTFNQVYMNLNKAVSDMLCLCPVDQAIEDQEETEGVTMSANSSKIWTLEEISLVQQHKDRSVVLRVAHEEYWKACISHCIPSHTIKAFKHKKHTRLQATEPPVEGKSQCW